MVVPDAVDSGTPGERVLRVGDPPGEGGAGGAFVVCIRQLEIRVEAGQEGGGAGQGGSAGLVDVAAFEDVDGARSGSGLERAVGREITGAGVNQLGLGEGGGFLFS